MSTETIEIFNNSDEWANQLKHALSKGENLALLHGLTPDILDRIYAYAFDYHEKGNITDAEIYYKFLCIYALYAFTTLDCAFRYNVYSANAL